MKRFEALHVFRQYWFSTGLDHQTGRFYLSFPVSNGLADYEEYYAVSESWAKYPEQSIEELKTFAEECRHHKHDDLLLEQPGTKRGTAV